MQRELGRNYNNGVPLSLKISGAGAFILGITGILLFYSSLPQLSYYGQRNEQPAIHSLRGNSYYHDDELSLSGNNSVPRHDDRNVTTVDDEDVVTVENAVAIDEKLLTDDDDNDNDEPRIPSDSHRPSETKSQSTVGAVIPNVISRDVAKNKSNVQRPIAIRDNRIYPISFGLPTNRYRRTNLTSVKIRDFASILPDYNKVYTYDTEESYYNSYSESFFGITFKKSGWDCLRHYEIIASGSIPFFMDIDKLPENTMFDFPVDLVKKAMALPGLPSVEAVKRYVRQPKQELLIDHDVFNITEYYKLRDAIYEYSIEYLTWSAKARYMMQVAQTHYPCIKSQPQRALLVSVNGCEYMSCIVWGSFYEEFGTERMSSLLGAKTPLFSSLAPAGENLYGRGFSYKDTYDEEWDEQKMSALTKERIKEGFFNVIIYMNGENRHCDPREYDKDATSLGIETHGGSGMLLEYQRTYNPLVITIDGNDIHGCHTFFPNDDVKLQHHLHFIREFNTTKESLQPLHNWNGCKS